jgi:Glycosyl transferases group 1
MSTRSNPSSRPSLTATIASWVTSRENIEPVLIFCSATGGVEWDHLESLSTHPGVKILEVDRLDAAAGVASDAAAVVCIQPHFRTSISELRHLCRTLRERGKTVVLLDSFDATSTPLFDVLPDVDLMFKKQLLRDRNQYRTPMAGGYVFTDFLQRELGQSIYDYQFGSYLADDQQHKVHLSWNIASSRHIHKLFHRFGLSWLGTRQTSFVRPIDVHCRLLLGDENSFYGQHRRHAIRALAPLTSSRHVVMTREGEPPVPRAQFYSELSRAKVCVSPFGWGEICYRDFEAMVLGCLLVKPSCDHLQTRPDLFIDGETYVACRWDLGDLAEKVDAALSDHDRRQRIVGQAYRRLKAFFDTGGAIPMARTLLDQVRRVRASGDAIAGPMPD